MFQFSKQRFVMAVVLLNLGLFTTRVLPAAENRKPVYSWKKTTASLALLNHGRVVWQFNHLQDGREKGCPYFHPLGTLDGTVLTDLRPGDHLWHRGLRFAWKKINGLEGYWSWPEGLSRWPDKEMGHTEVTAVKVFPGKDFSARFELELSYHPDGKPAVLTEKRTIVVSAPDNKGRYQIDWQGNFTAGPQGAVLDRTPILGEEGGKPWGGYAGLQFRVIHRDKLNRWTLLNSEGISVTNKADQKKKSELETMHGKQARWMDITLDFKDGKTAGATLFDHPGNLRFPAVWHVSSMPNELIQTPIFHSAYNLKSGKSLSFHYLIMIHPGQGEKKFLEKQWNEFTKSTGAENQ